MTSPFDDYQPDEQPGDFYAAQQQQYRTFIARTLGVVLLGVVTWLVWLAA